VRADYEKPGYAVRLFEPTSGGSRTKFHRSNSLVEHARAFGPTCCVIKGVDGGAGVHLVDAYLKPKSVPFAMIVGGKFYTSRVADAAQVLVETGFQRDRLIRPRRPWRRRIEPKRIAVLPKTIDTDRFRPMPGVAKRWDLLAIGRLIPRYKNYRALGAFPPNVRIAVAGGGPELEKLKARFPGITWLGPVPHSEIPELMNGSRLFFHTGLRDYYPRVLAEAAACGVPSVAFGSAIDEDVLPPERGLRVGARDMVSSVKALLADSDRRAEMSRSAREYAEATLSRSALVPHVDALMRHFERN
jgi:glycosyltransferase involved in cell wall biosynthesis